MSNLFLQLRLAARLFRLKKSYSATSVIAVVAIAGVAVATAAIICVLSVFNGFHNILTGNLSRLSPDIELRPTVGKVFDLKSDVLVEHIKGLEGVADASEVLSDNALILYGSRELPVMLHGVDAEYLQRTTDLDSMIIGGTTFSGPAQKQMLASVGIATQIDFYHPGEFVLLFAPRREGRINTANPVASFVTDSLQCIGVFESRQSEIDANTVYCDISVARRLFDRPKQSSSIQIGLEKGYDADKIAGKLKEICGDGIAVRTRAQQADVNFRMVKIEKWVSFLLLIFILIIASFNIISALSMIVLEKRGNIGIFHSLGMSRKQIGGVFFIQGMYVGLSGGIIGAIIGVLLSLGQEKFGFIKIAGGDASQLLVQSYPVELQWSDVGIAMLPIIAISVVAALISSAFARSRI